MAACPCGCGRNLGFMKRRMALQAVDLAVAFPIIELLKFSADHVVPEYRSHITTVLLEGRAMSSAMLRSAHGEGVATYELPALARLRNWQHLANRLVGAVNEKDPDWVKDYMARLPVSQQKLVQSMIFWSDAQVKGR